MKYPIISLLLLTSLISCNESGLGERQEEREEERASYNDFFMNRSERAKSIKDHNYSITPGASPTLEESRIQEEQEQLPEGVQEGIIPESQEEKPQNLPSVNGASETEYLKEQQSENQRHYDGRDFEQKRQKKKVK